MKYQKALLSIVLLSLVLLLSINYTEAKLVSNTLGVDCSSITGATSNLCTITSSNGSGISWGEAINGTLVLNSSLSSYLKVINWNSTNTSYLTSITNIFNQNLNTTSNVTFASLNISNVINFSNPTLATGTPSAICRQTTGEITYNGIANTCLVSSIKYKTNITYFSNNVTSNLLLLNPAEFNFNNDSYLRYGLIAENVSGVFPELVVYEPSNNSDPRTILYEGLTTLLLKGFQEQETKINSLNLTGLIKDWNSSGLIINWSLYSSEPNWNTNYSIFLTHALNSSLIDYLKTSNWNSTNTSYYLSTNPFSFYNSTNPPPSTDSFIANYSNFSRVYANITLYNTSWSSTFNNSYDTWLGNYSGYNTTWSNTTNLTYHTWLGNWSGYNSSWNNITNVSLTSWTNALNGTLAEWIDVTNGTMLSYAQALNNTLVQNTTANKYNLSLSQLRVNNQGVNITTNLTLFKEDNGTGYIRFGNRTTSALVACVSANNGTLAVNNTGLWWCGGANWVRLAV